jgi:hypothetical protein
MCIKWEQNENRIVYFSSFFFPGKYSSGLCSAGRQFVEHSDIAVTSKQLWRPISGPKDGNHNYAFNDRAHRKHPNLRLDVTGATSPRHVLHRLSLSTQIINTSRAPGAETHIHSLWEKECNYVYKLGDKKWTHDTLSGLTQRERVWLVISVNRAVWCSRNVQEF